jgi:hypothetical protein
LKSTVREDSYHYVMRDHKKFWDEEGTPHEHDPSFRVARYSCSNKHEWVERSPGVCYTPDCSWEGDLPDPTLEVLEDGIKPRRVLPF